MDHAFCRGFEDSIREVLVTDCPRQDQRARHDSKGRYRVFVAAGTAGPRHQLGYEIERLRQFRGEGIANALRLFGDLAAQGSDYATRAGRVAMIPRQISRHDGGKRLPTSIAFQQAPPEAPGPCQRLAHCLGRDGFFGSELAVDGAVSQTGVFGDCVNTGGTDAAFAKQAAGRGNYFPMILRRLFLRNPHRISSRICPLDSFDYGRHQCNKQDGTSSIVLHFSPLKRFVTWYLAHQDRSAYRRDPDQRVQAAQSEAQDSRSSAWIIRADRECRDYSVSGRNFRRSGTDVCRERQRESSRAQRMVLFHHLGTRCGLAVCRAPPRGTQARLSRGDDSRRIRQKLFPPQSRGDDAAHRASQSILVRRAAERGGYSLDYVP